MTETPQKLADIARKKRHLHLIEKLHSGKPLSKSEINELDDFESEPLAPAVVNTMEEVAKVMEVSYRTVQRWKKDGMPITTDGHYNLDAIRLWHDGRATAEGEEAQGKAYWDEKIRKYKATLLQLDLAKATGELVSRKEIETGRLARITAIKRALLAIPTRLAPVLAMKKPREIETHLYETIAEIIDDFAGGDHEKTT